MYWGMLQCPPIGIIEEMSKSARCRSMGARIKQELMRMNYDIRIANIFL